MVNSLSHFCVLVFELEKQKSSAKKLDNKVG